MGDEKSTISHAFYVNFEDWIKVSLLKKKKIDVQPFVSVFEEFAP